MFVAAPAGDRSIGSHAAGVHCPCADRDERAPRGRGPAGAVVAPACDCSIGPYPTGMVPAGAHRGEGPGRRCRLPVDTGAPAGNSVSGRHPTGEIAAGADGDEEPEPWRGCPALPIIAPAHHWVDRVSGAECAYVGPPGTDEDKVLASPRRPAKRVPADKIPVGLERACLAGADADRNEVALVCREGRESLVGRYPDDEDGDKQGGEQHGHAYEQGPTRPLAEGSYPRALQTQCPWISRTAPARVPPHREDHDQQRGEHRGQAYEGATRLFAEYCHPGTLQSCCPRTSRAAPGRRPRPAARTSAGALRSRR